MCFWNHRHWRNTFSPDLLISFLWCLHSIYSLIYLPTYSFIHLPPTANDTFTLAGQRSSSVPHSPRILPPKSLGIERIHFRKSSIGDQLVDARQPRWVPHQHEGRGSRPRVFSPKWPAHCGLVLSILSEGYFVRPKQNLARLFVAIQVEESF